MHGSEKNLGVTSVACLSADRAEVAGNGVEMKNRGLKIRGILDDWTY